MSPAEVAASLPPLTDEQVERVAALLRTVRQPSEEASACAS